MKKLTIGMHKALQLINLFDNSEKGEKQHTLKRYRQKPQEKTKGF